MKPHNSKKQKKQQKQEGFRHYCNQYLEDVREDSMSPPWDKSRITTQSSIFVTCNGGKSSGEITTGLTFRSKQHNNIASPPFARYRTSFSSLPPPSNDAETRVFVEAHLNRTTECIDKSLLKLSEHMRFFGRKGRNCNFSPINNKTDFLTLEKHWEKKTWKGIEEDFKCKSYPQLRYSNHYTLIPNTNVIATNCSRDISTFSHSVYTLAIVAGVIGLFSCLLYLVTCLVNLASQRRNNNTGQENHSESSSLREVVLTIENLTENQTSLSEDKQNINWLTASYTSHSPNSDINKILAIFNKAYTDYNQTLKAYISSLRRNKQDYFSYTVPEKHDLPTCKISKKIANIPCSVEGDKELFDLLTLTTYIMNQKPSSSSNESYRQLFLKNITPNRYVKEKYNQQLTTLITPSFNVKPK